MRVLLASNHRYPLAARQGAGRAPTAIASGSGQHLHDLLARGLAELGHRVFYLLPADDHGPMPPGLVAVREPVADVDIAHGLAYHEQALSDLAGRVPLVATCHLGPALVDKDLPAPPPHWIYVSAQQARDHGSDRHVVCGIDPAEYVYRERKADYLLFMASMKWYRQKGLLLALRLAKHSGSRLVVAGSAADSVMVREVARLCRDYGADYRGDVRGADKAELLAGARALVLPTELAEGGPLVIAEALMSGTPVIVSDRGGCPAMVDAATGFVCRAWDDYVRAVARLDRIGPGECRHKAETAFHYHRMVRDYLIEYRREIEAFTARQKARHLPVR